MQVSQELDGLWVVYGLVSSRARWLFYIGSTSKLSQRIESHYSCNIRNATAGTIREMRDAGESFTHCVFGVYGRKRDALDVEAKLIRTAPNLINVKGNPENAHLSS